MSTKMSDALSATNVIAYHYTELAANYAAAYYSEDGRAQGLWYGKQCEALGLKAGAPVDELHFTRLANGHHPMTGEQLIQWKTAGQRQPRWVQDDATWKAHVEGLLVQAIEEGRDVFKCAAVAGQQQPQNSGESHAETRGRVVEPSPSVRTAQETALLEMHAIARQTYIDTLNSDNGRAARQYVASRGIRPKTAAEFGLGLSDGSGHQLVDKLQHYGPDLMRTSGLFIERPDHTFYDRFRDRLMFPIENERGETIAFGGRRGPGDTHSPKYINSQASELYDKSQTLYNLHRAAGSMAHHNKAVVVEGYLDVLAAHQAGQRNVVAPCGTALTPAQVEKLRECVDGSVLNFDEDTAGRNATEKAVQTALRGGLTPRVMSLDADPADWLQKHSAKEYKAAVRDAMPLVQYFADRAQEMHPQIAADAAEPYPGARFDVRMDAQRWFQSALNSVPAEHRQAVSESLRQHLGATPEEGSGKKQQTQLEHRAGWDLTFSAGKSVSITALVGADNRLVAAHDEAVREALATASVPFRSRWEA